MVSFVVIYRGDSIQTAELVAVSTNPSLVAHVAGDLLRERNEATRDGLEADPVLDAVRDGRRRALEFVHAESEESR